MKISRLAAVGVHLACGFVTAALGGRVLGFNADDRFSDALDGLIMVDLRATDPRLLARYMGEEGAVAFLACHEADPRLLRRVS